MTNISELQQEIKELVSMINATHKHPHPELISFLKVVEELGEITPLLISTQIKSRKHDKLDKSQVKHEVGKEVADCIIALLSLANDFGIDIERCIDEKMKKHIDRNKIVKS